MQKNDFNNKVFKDAAKGLKTLMKDQEAVFNKALSDMPEKDRAKFRDVMDIAKTGDIEKFNKALNNILKNGS